MQRKLHLLVATLALLLCGTVYADDIQVDWTSSVGLTNTSYGNATGTYSGYTGYNSTNAVEYYTESATGWACAEYPISQTVSGLDQGSYTVTFYATANLANWSNGTHGYEDTSASVSTAAQVYAVGEGDTVTSVLPTWYSTGLTSDEPYEYSLDVTVGEEGTLSFGIHILETGLYVNWCTAQIISLVQTISEDDVESIYQTYVTTAQELVGSEYLVSSIAEALQECIDATDITDYEAAIASIQAAITAAEANIAQNQTLAEGGSVDAGSALTGWATTNSQTLQYNTWSTETDNYGVSNPFVENWVASGGTLDAGSQTYYTAEGLKAGAYKVTGTVRALREAGNDTITGATFFANAITEDLTQTGTLITDFNSSTKSALYGFIELGVRLDEEGDLTFGLSIGEDANYNWVAFKDFAITAITDTELADVSELDSVIAASEAAYEAGFYGEGLFLIPTADGEAYAEAIAAAQAVYDNAYATADDVTAAIAALQEADAVFAAVEVNQPNDTVLYTFQQTASGYYLSIDEESEGTSSNIVLDDDEYPFYIVTRNDSVMLMSQSGEYICHYGSSTWTMGTSTDGGSTGTVHSFTITPYEEVDGTVHYVLVCAYNSLSVASDGTDVGSAFYDNKSIGHANGIWVISEYVPVEDPLGKKELLKAITTSTKVYDAASVGSALFQHTEEGATAYAEAIATAQAVYDSEDEAQTADDVTAAIEALATADEAFAAAVNTPAEGQLYTLQNKQTGFYLAVNDDATATTGNIVMSSTDQEGWYISYDSSTGYSQIYNEAGEYLCYAGTTTWTMGTTGTTFDIGIIPTEVDDVCYHQLEVYVNSRTRIIGTASDTSDPATLYCDKVYSSIGDWGLWTIAEVSATDESEGDVIGGYNVVGVEVVEVEVLEKTAYTGDTAEFDLDAVLAALGVEDIASCSQYIINATDSSFVTNSTDSWRNADGDMESWGTSAGMVCVKIDDPSSGVIDYIGTIDDAYEAGDEYDAYWAFTYGENAYIIDVHITFVAAEEVEAEIVATIDVDVALQEATAYSGDTAEFDVDAVCEALGITDITEAEQYIVNVTDGSYVTNSTDGWRDANGDAASWGNDGGVCVKIQDPASGLIDYIGCYDTTYAAGATYTAKWAFVYDAKAVIINVNITFVTEEVYTGINAISGNGTFEATGIYSISGQLVRTQATSLENLPQGIYIVNGKKVLVK